MAPLTVPQTARIEEALSEVSIDSQSTVVTLPNFADHSENTST